MNLREINRKIKMYYTNLQLKNEKKILQINEKYRFNNPKYKEIEDEFNLKKRTLIKRIGIILDVNKEYENLLNEKNKKIKEFFLENDEFNKELNNVYNCKKCKDTGKINNKICICYKKYRASLIRKQLLKEQNELIKFKFEDFKKNIYSNEIVPIKTKNGVENYNLPDYMCELMKYFLNNIKENNLKNYVFLGKVGVGKTFFASCILNELINKGYTAYCAKELEILNLIRLQSLGEIDESFYTLFDVEVLFIDDLGTGVNTNLDYMKFFNLIEKRISDDNKITIITTNLTKEQISKYYTERLYSRIRSKFETHFIYGKDLR